MSKKKELRKLAEKCIEILKSKYKVKRIFIIGSIVSGFVHEKSDIDLVVVGLPAELYIKALTDLYDFLPQGTELNLIPFESAFKSFRTKIVKEGKLVYET